MQVKLLKKELQTQFGNLAGITDLIKAQVCAPRPWPSGLLEGVEENRRWGEAGLC